MKITGITTQTVTGTRISVGRRLRGVSVPIPVRPTAGEPEEPKAASYTFYQYTPAAEWVFTNPTNHTPSVTVYMLSGVEADTDIDFDGHQITVTWGSPRAGYVVIT